MNTHTLTGEILRKKKKKGHGLVLAVRPSQREKSLALCLPFDLLKFWVVVGSIVRVEYASEPFLKDNHTDQLPAVIGRIYLVRCAPTPQAIQRILDILSRPPVELATPLIDGEGDPAWKCSIFNLSCDSGGGTNDEIWSLEDCILWEGLDDMSSWVDWQRLSSQQRRTLVNRIIQTIQGKTRKRRHRPPHTKVYEIERLAEIEGAALSHHTRWRLLDPVGSNHLPDSRLPVNQLQQEASGAGTSALNLPQGLLECTSETNASTSSPVKITIEQRRRVEYLLEKKQTQIDWMIQRVQQIWENVRRDERSPQALHILDVGGGRGDLAIALACHIPYCHVIVVDCNASSLHGGAAYAESQPHIDHHRVHFCHADFADYVQNPTAYVSMPITFVVALHACGDLSDSALQFAQAKGLPFVVCPCCYTKRYLRTFQPSWREPSNFHSHDASDKWSLGSLVRRDNNQKVENDNLLGRLAELDGRPEISRRAMTIINSIRLYGLKRDGNDEAQQYKMLALEEYSREYSHRNQVLVGMPYCGPASV